jgi:hypothetical protein
VLTALRPRFDLITSPSVQLRYESEIGWESWGGVNPGMPHPYAPNRIQGLSMRHRQMWGQYRTQLLKFKVQFRAGIQQISDPSELFLFHLAGALSLKLQFKTSALNLIFAQLPENQFEGVSLNEDNWVHDNVIGSVQWKGKTKKIKWGIAGSFLRDHRVVGRPLELGVGSGNIQWKASKNLRTQWSFAYQGGRWQNSGRGGRDQIVNAWATKGNVTWQVNRFKIKGHVLALSADQGDSLNAQGDAQWGGFFYTGQNQSSTLILTQDEERDRYDNLDERMSTMWGSHFVNHAGLLVADLALSYRVNSIYTPQIVLGYGQVLENTHTLNQASVGTELGLLNTFKVAPNASFFFHLQGFLPGQAASAKINDQDRTAQQMLYGIESGFRAQF